MSESADDDFTDAAKMAAAAGLVYVTDGMPGIRRLREPDGFSYVRADGKRIVDDDELARIAKLAIPPAYEDVWICRNPKGHLQATGHDARGRKQYRYHPEWRQHRDDAKFRRMVDFGKALPRLRRRLGKDLAQKGLPRDKVLAVIVSLLDATRVRVGNVEYARDNKSFGLTTLRNRHARFVRDGRLILQFRGKGGAEHEVLVDDKRLARLVRRCHELPGQRLFQYVGDDGARRPIDSDQVNTYLQEVMDAPFTAKDFRTWGATLHAITLMATTPLPEPATETAIKSCIVAAIRQVAADLRNTPTVCRKSYINPVVFDAWRNGRLQQVAGTICTAAPRKAERLALAFLRDASSPRARKSQPRVAGHAAIARNGRRDPAAIAHRQSRESANPASL
ncbi:MAG: DNA topoisomerase IB [Betaproteobacteria bacterium]